VTADFQDECLQLPSLYASCQSSQRLFQALLPVGVIAYNREVIGTLSCCFCGYTMHLASVFNVVSCIRIPPSQASIPSKSVNTSQKNPQLHSPQTHNN